MAVSLATSPSPLVRQRLLSQQLARPRLRSAGELVSRLGAVQAQDYPGSLWALGQRLAGAREVDVEAALAAGAIVRTWPMRGTLHYVAAADVRWMLALCAPRMVARAAGRYRELGLDGAAFARAGNALARELEGGRRLERREAYAVIERAGVSAAGQRGIHILGHLAQQGLVCYGPRRGRQPTFVLLDEWAPSAAPLPREEALATLAGRYVAGHGPAATHDFAWWSGLPVKDALAALHAAAEAGAVRAPRHGGLWHAARAPAAAAGRGPGAWLLPPWDEYLVAYQDRAAMVLDRRGLENRLGTLGSPVIVIDGVVRGTWRRALGPARVSLALSFWGRATSAEREAVREAALRYGRFLGKDVDL
jgi:hypothetical protein